MVIDVKVKVVDLGAKGMVGDVVIEDVNVEVKILVEIVDVLLDFFLVIVVLVFLISVWLVASMPVEVGFFGVVSGLIMFVF